MPPRAAARLAVLSAVEIDRELEESQPELISSIEKFGGKFRLYRSEHRKLNLDEIEDLLRVKGPTT